MGDRTLTFEYSLSGGGATSIQKSVTAREFAYAENNTPSNTCTLGYGTKRAYVYTVYTHPDHAALQSEDSLSNTPVEESFSPSLACGEMGNTVLDADAQFSDNIASCSTAPLTCTQTVTQKISVAGYLVRTNTLQWAASGVTYTSDGPTQ